MFSACYISMRGGGGIEAQYCMHGGGQQGNTMDTFVKYSKVPILIANR